MVLFLINLCTNPISTIKRD